MNEQTTRLESLSDKIRQGIPINLSDALEVINYQEKLRLRREAEKEKTLLRRFFRWFDRP